MTYFADIPAICFQGAVSTEPLAYRYYDPKRSVLGKTMAEHLRMAVCFWHTFCWQGNDIFGEPTFERPWQGSQDPMTRAKARVAACFEFVTKLGLEYYTFHDRDVAPEGSTLKESIANLNHIADLLEQEMQRTNVQLLWGTANLFSHKRFMAGAATNPDPTVFAYACSQVKAALDVTHRLQGANYVLWGGREGYDTLLNTNLKQEADQLARFLGLLVDYKHRIGFKGALLIEPKPCEPTKHQYDYDTATVLAFLEKYDLATEFKVNIETNHATLAKHSFPHEIAYAYANGIFGSIDANQGDPQLGWDTDQFPGYSTDLIEALYIILQNGGFTTGGFNFDTKLRRQSIDLKDLFYGHIAGIDNLARALLAAANLIEQKKLHQFVVDRYAGWNKGVGKMILAKETRFEDLAHYAESHALDPAPVSGQQEYLERLLTSSMV